MIDQPDFPEEMRKVFERYPRENQIIDVPIALQQFKELWEKYVVPADTAVLYNIHKRSLPTRLDQVVGMGFTQEEGIKFINTRLKARHIEDLNDKVSIIYYDLVRQDGLGKGIYDNYGVQITTEHMKRKQGELND